MRGPGIGDPERTYCAYGVVATALGLHDRIAGCVRGAASAYTFYEKSKKHLQPTGILVRPDRTIEIAVYSTGPIGRFVADDVLKIVRYYKS